MAGRMVVVMWQWRYHGRVVVMWRLWYHGRVVGGGDGSGGGGVYIKNGCIEINIDGLVGRGSYLRTDKIDICPGPAWPRSPPVTIINYFKKFGVERLENGKEKSGEKRNGKENKGQLEEEREGAPFIFTGSLGDETPQRSNKRIKDEEGEGVDKLTYGAGSILDKVELRDYTCILGRRGRELSYELLQRKRPKKPKKKVNLVPKKKGKNRVETLVRPLLEQPKPKAAEWTTVKRKEKKKKSKSSKRVVPNEVRILFEETQKVREKNQGGYVLNWAPSGKEGSERPKVAPEATEVQIIKNLWEVLSKKKCVLRFRKLKKVVGDRFFARHPSGGERNPHIIVHGVGIEVKDDEVAVLLEEQNESSVNLAAEWFKNLELVSHKSRVTRKGRDIEFVVTPEVLGQIVGQTLCVGLSRCRVGPSVNVRRCYRCHRYGHMGATCNAPSVVCGRCAGSHHAAHCVARPTEIRCTSCAASGWECDHVSGDTVKCRTWEVNLGRGKLATDDLLSEIRERGLDVVLIQEPFVTGSGTFASLGRFPTRLIMGYSPGEKPAAAVLVVNPSLGATLITQFSRTHLVIVEILCGEKSLYVGSTYCQFSDETDVHVKRLESMIRDLGGVDWLIGGDFNARSTLWNDTHTDDRGEKAEDMIMSGEMICCNNGSVPTFQTSMGSAILDLTLASVKVAASIREWKVHDNAITSDHGLITFGYDDIEEGDIEERKSKSFNVRKADWNVFRQRLAEKLFDGQSAWLEKDIQSRVDYLTRALNEACRKSMPMIKSRKVEAPSWFTETLDTQRRIVKRIRRKIGKSHALGFEERTAALEEIYRRERNKYTEGRRKEQMRTWRKFTTEEGNEKPWWSTYRWCKEGANTDSRESTIGVTGAYRTTSTKALPVLAGVLPLDLVARQWGRLARSRRTGLGKEQVRDIEEEGIAEWQTRWEASEKGRLTYVEVDHESSQFLKGHGGFMAYLHRFSKSETDECQQCGCLDMAEHVVFECEALSDTRKALRYLVEVGGQPWPCQLSFLVGSPELWKEFRLFMRGTSDFRGHVVGRPLDEV
ncbi:hypothetical protein AGLY_017950 [Aphis glycines]|uniref:CCHC-type domain-containing protein n=1 Tax=Aphis glycines TaxID=307491 RepID=A0A6G0SUL1_APHGL|nr:hypothetical protein AGLY_017950 [Aphis glycines]